MLTISFIRLKIIFFADHLDAIKETTSAVLDA